MTRQTVHLTLRELRTLVRRLRSRPPTGAEAVLLRRLRGRLEDAARRHPDWQNDPDPVWDALTESITWIEAALQGAEEVVWSRQWFPTRGWIRWFSTSVVSHD